MKGCFHLQRNFAPISHSIILQLQKRYGMTEFCGLVHTRRSYNFLNEQKDVPYTSLILDEDIHEEYKTEKLDLDYLRSFEQKYGIPNLWALITADRILMQGQLLHEYPHDTPIFTHEEILRMFQVTAKRLVAFLEKEKPDFVFLVAVGSIASTILFHVAKKMGIRIIVIHQALLEDTHILSESYDSFTEVDELFQRSATEDILSPASFEKAKKAITQFRTNARPHWVGSDPRIQPVTREKQMLFLTPSRLWKIATWLVEYSKRSLTGPERNDYSYIKMRDYIWDATKRKVRNMRGVADLYDTYEPAHDTFAFFPLHYEPELSLTLYAPFATNQLNVIKDCARSLPVGWKLYVKEHPDMVQFRPRRYYKELKKIPNVKLIDPTKRSIELIKACGLVMTITSSAGWEATFIGKPVITLGKIFYNALPFVRHTDTPKDLPFVVEEILKNFTYDEPTLERYLAALFEHAVPCSLQYLWEIENSMEKKYEGVEKVADGIARIMKITPIASSTNH